MLTVVCDMCFNDLNEQGGLYFTPPDINGKTRKYHICIECNIAILHLIETR